MPLKQKNFYVSTALPYVNSAPHIGFALEIIQADVIARNHRFLGEEVFFLTGTDENSLKNVKAAQEQGISVKNFVDKNAKKFYELKEILNLSFDDFIKTSEERHKNGAEKFWRACKKDIYKKAYKGLYCVGCEAFYKENELINGLCPEHNIRPELIEEENYFFTLSKYQKRLKKIIQEDEVEIIPKTRKNEILSFINSGLEDFCISRDIKRSQGWGVPVPGDSTQIQWTWFDALSNYINAPGYADDNKKFQKLWQKNENKLHIIGKGVLRFHAVYWLSMLLSANLSLPKRIFAHGYLTVNNEKMSKSLRNVVSPFELVEKYGTDPVRYFLLREIPPTKDGDFTYEKFENRYNSDMASGLGNLVARIIKMAIGLNSKFQIQTKSLSPEIQARASKIYENRKKFLEEFKFNDSLKSIWDLIGFCDRYIEKEKPWQKNEKQKNTIKNLLYLLFNIANLIQPFLPETAEKIFKQLGIKPEKITGKLNKILNFKIKEAKPLFPKL